MKYLLEISGPPGYEVAYKRRELDPMYSDKTGMWNVQPLVGTKWKATI